MKHSLIRKAQKFTWGVIGAIRPGKTIDYKNAIDLIKHPIVNTTEIGNLKNGFLQGNNHNGDYSKPWR